MAATEDHEDLMPSNTPGYKATDLKSVEHYKNLDQNDESLNRWKASLGLSNADGAPASGPKITVTSLFLTSPTLPPGKQLNLNVSEPSELASFKKNPLTIKEGVEYSVGITFIVNHSLVTGIKYIQLVKRAGVKVDKLEEMLGSYAPQKDGIAYTKVFASEESPSGLLARSGTYNVKSRVIDDDGEIYADFEWCFKLAKEW